MKKLLLFNENKLMKIEDIQNQLKLDVETLEILYFQLLLKKLILFNDKIIEQKIIEINKNICFIGRKKDFFNNRI